MDLERCLSLQCPLTDKGRENGGVLAGPSQWHIVVLSPSYRMQGLLCARHQEQAVLMGRHHTHMHVGGKVTTHTSTRRLSPQKDGLQAYSKLDLYATWTSVVPALHVVRINRDLVSIGLLDVCHSLGCGLLSEGWRSFGEGMEPGHRSLFLL